MTDTGHDHGGDRRTGIEPSLVSSMIEGSNIRPYVARWARCWIFCSCRKWGRMACGRAVRGSRAGRRGATESSTATLAAPAGRRPALHRAAFISLAYLGTAAAVLVVGLPTLILPFWPDQAIFSMIGRVIWEGGYPYVDAWDQKPPSIYFIYAVAIHGPFDVMRNLRVFDLA